MPRELCGNLCVVLSAMVFKSFFSGLVLASECDEKIFLGFILNKRANKCCGSAM